MAANRFGIDPGLQVLDTSFDNTPQSDEEQGSPEPSGIELEAPSGDAGRQKSQVLEPRSQEEDSGHTGDSEDDVDGRTERRRR
jgi:hypothetical protein